MLHRSKSWPIQSVITLDPRGIIYASVQSPWDNSTNSQIREVHSTGKPDVVIQVKRRIPLVVKPDIFVTFEPEPSKSSNHSAEPVEITFVDHYQVLDGVNSERDQSFVVPVTSKQPTEWIESIECRRNHQSALDAAESRVSFANVPSGSDAESKLVDGTAKCRKCRFARSTSHRQKLHREQVATDARGEVEQVEPEEMKQLLTGYQIELLRRNCLKSLNRTTSGSIDINCSTDKDEEEEEEEAAEATTAATSTATAAAASGKKFRKALERKLTSEFESVASNETKTTDCDEKCATTTSRKQPRGSDKRGSFQLIRSYSLGHEQTRERLTGTFKKFSLPTPVIQLKEENENPENPREDRDSALQNLKLDKRKVMTLTRHYYPENGWGYVIVTCSVIVHILCHGLQLSAGVIMVPAAVKFTTDPVHTGWLGALSTAVALFLSPITIAYCRKKSTRVTAVVGGLITALGCLFTSFASQFHQLFFSYGTVIGVGVSLTRDCSTLMVAQYFKRRRELVEIFIVSGSGLGISIMSACIQGAINAIGWRLGLQAVTGAIFLTFILGTFYRSASLYHPQRRAILHLKNQKRKIKDKNKSEEKQAFLDTTALRSKTVRILLASTGLSAFGINTPIFYLARQAEQEGLGERAVILQAYLGLAWVLGCAAFGLVVVHNSVECRIARQYLCQAAVFMCGLSILALTAVHGNYHGYVLFVWIYGIFCGGYHYSLKMYTYEKVRARNFAKTWGFVQCSQAIPIALGVPISGYMNEGCGGKAGYYFSSTCTLAGSLAMFLIDIHRRRISRHKHTKDNGQRHLCESEACPRRRPSFGAEPEPDPPLAELPMADLVQVIPGEKPELTCISEEGIADMDLPDNLLDELDYIGITSCNKVENYLMLSEFENNLIAETPVLLDKRGRRWSLAKRPDIQLEEGAKWRLVTPKRRITVIDEASV